MIGGPSQSDFFIRLVQPAQTKIVMLVMDGLGGLPREAGGKTELETAHTPHLDALAKQSDCGLTLPVAQGVTPGSGPGHLALFSYDPTTYVIGRGAMEALGAGFELLPGDLAARGNFCSLDHAGMITDRRAGRIPNEKSHHLINLLASIQLPGAQVFIEPVREHRFAFILRSSDLGEALSDTDPQSVGVPPLPVKALDPGSARSAELVGQFIASARHLLVEQFPANMILLRGFARLPSLPGFPERYALNPAAIAIQGMYRGVARMVGMQVLSLPGQTLVDEFIALEQNWDHFDFFYLHIKKVDTCGEMGDFDGKVKAIEEVDALLPRLTRLNPDVIIVAGDHSSPAIMKAHSWHPVPLLVYSRNTRSQPMQKFGEAACSHGSLGIIPATQVMALALAHAMRLAKYGA
jgi:2,3-bisphosphoglycerate-independent phosphoglycerate mutase